jgi:hypothetical protein
MFELQKFGNIPYGLIDFGNVLSFWLPAADQGGCFLVSVRDFEFVERYIRMGSKQAEGT